MEFFGIKLVGVNEENGQKVLLTIFVIVSIFMIKGVIHWFLDQFQRYYKNRKLKFWTRQSINLFAAFTLFLVILSIWFDDPTRLATGLGLVTAGLAFALQKVVTSLAGYLIIMRGNTFSVGERITMGGIRGDVIALGFLQTTIMEMGQPQSVQGAEPAMWVKARQFTGRIVTVTNDKIFESPVYNYSRDFPFIWEEMSIPLKYNVDRSKAESILTEVVNRHTKNARDAASSVLQTLATKYGIQGDDMLPKVYYRLTDNWLEFTVRFIIEVHGIRDVKDLIARDLLKSFEEAGIELASATFEIVGLPTIHYNDGGPPETRTRTHLRAADFESATSTIPSGGHLSP